MKNPSINDRRKSYILTGEPKYQPYPKIIVFGKTAHMDHWSHNRRRWRFWPHKDICFLAGQPWLVRKRSLAIGNSYNGHT